MVLRIIIVLSTIYTNKLNKAAAGYPMCLTCSVVIGCSAIVRTSSVEARIVVQTTDRTAQQLVCYTDNQLQF